MALDLSGMNAIPKDSAIFCPTDKVRRILLGIDIGEEDIRRAKDTGYDLVITHHPIDQTRFMSVMDRQEKLMHHAGVSADKAEKACRQNKAVYEKWTQSLPHDENTDRLIALAHTVRIGFMNIHQPCDEIGRRILQDMADAAGASGTVSSLMDTYQTLPEMTHSTEGIQLVCGDPDATTGKTMVIHAAGTNGGYPVATALFESGIGTVVYIHLHSNDQAARLRKENKGNLILTGHYASDSLGINPLVDALENAGVEVDCCNKMTRVKHTEVNQALCGSAYRRP